MAGSALPPLPTATVWTAGGRAEVTWQITANHGGGYQYRLCPASAPPTESCFAALPLLFNTEAQRLQWNNGTTTHIKVELDVKLKDFSLLFLNLNSIPTLRAHL